MSLRKRRLALWTGRAIVRFLGLLVPRRRRAAWREEWEAELIARHDAGAMVSGRDEPTARRDAGAMAPRDAEPAARHDAPRRRSPSTGAPALLRHAVGAFFDAWWHFRQEWSSDMLIQDLRFAARSLAARPVLTAVVVGSLAFGIGANTVIYSIVDGVVLNPFAFPDNDRVIGVGAAYPALNEDLVFWEALSAPDYVEIKEQLTALEHVAGFDMGNRQIYGGDVPQNLFSAFWWDDAFPAVGMQPLLGRGFDRRDFTGETSSAIISHRVWRARFAADESAIGRTILVDADPYTLIGVMPPGLNIYNTDLWLPMWANPRNLPRQRRQFNVIARLADGATLRQAEAELEGLARRIEASFGDEIEAYRGWSLAAMTWTDVNVRTLRPAAVILLSAVGFVLLLVCANVASLLVARSAARRRELAVRTALGAGRLRLVRQLLTESLLLALGGGLLGVLFSIASLDAIVSQLVTNVLPFQIDVAINARVLLYTGAVAMLAGLVFGTVPALQASRFDLQRALASESGHSTGSVGRRRWNATFVVVEVALALTLLVGAGLLIHSFVRLQAVDTGVDSDNVLTMRLTLPWSQYEGDRIVGFFELLEDRVESIPGVVAAATGSQFPPVAFSRVPFAVDGAAPPEDDRLPTAYATLVGDGYFDALGIPVLRGRPLGPTEVAGSQPAAVVNTVAARRWFGDEDAVGRRLRIRPADGDAPSYEVVGVVGATHNRGLGVDPQPEIFAHMRQTAGSNNQFFLLVRTAVDPHSVLPAVRDAVAGIDPQQPVYAVRTLEEAFSFSIVQQRFAMWALVVFGAAALGLAAIGIYGIVSWAVAERTREIGVRMALGAGRHEVSRQMVRQAMLPVAIGMLLGLGLAVGAGAALSNLLYEVGFVDPVSLLAVVAAFFATALLASWLPARRASRVDPLVALRTD